MNGEEDNYISETEEELRRIYEQDEPDTPSGPLEWLLAAIGFIFAAAWLLIRFAIPILILVGIVGAATGLFDKEEIAEDRSNPGWELVRELRDSGEISEFKAVEPDDGWQWQYELDSGTDLRFRQVSGVMEMEYRTRSQSLEEAINKVAEKHGYFDE